MARIGFTKYIPSNNRALEREFRILSVTDAALAKIDNAAQVKRLVKVVQHNIDAFFETLMMIERQPPHLRFFRIPDLLPAYVTFRWLYDEPVIKDLVRRELARAGEFATKHDIRLVMHAGRYPLGLDQAHAIDAIEASADILQLMGLGDATISTTVGSVADFRVGLTRLSEAARAVAVVENDMITGLDELLVLGDLLPIVVNLHTHWFVRLGEYLWADDSMIARIIESWHGARPYGRLSTIRSGLPGTTANVLPSYRLLIDNKVRLRDMATPGDQLWNSAVNEWACEHLRWMDIEVEAKTGFAAAQQLADHAIMRNFIFMPPRRP